MRDLIGKSCSVEYTAESHRYPKCGTQVVVLAVDMPMVKMRGIHDKDHVWVNCSLIKTITPDFSNFHTQSWFYYSDGYTPYKPAQE